MAAIQTVSPISTSTTTWQAVDGVLLGVRWTSPIISFSFPNSRSDYDSNYGSIEPSNGLGFFATAEQAPFIRVLNDYYAAIAPLEFIQYHDGDADTAHNAIDATIRIAKTIQPSIGAWAYDPSTTPRGGDAWFDNSAGTRFTFNPVPQAGSYTFAVYMHEMGHSLGLKHSFENGPTGTVPRDSFEYTVMSYSPFEGTSNWKLTAEGNFPQTLMQYDIAGIQRMYGANYDTNDGNTVYRWDATTGSLTTFDSVDGTRIFDAPGTNKIFMTVWDGGGIDTFNFSNYGSGITVDIRPGGWTTVSRQQLADLDGNDRDGNGRADVADGNIAVALESRGPNGEVIAQYIENVIGTAFSDSITGNTQANTITSLAGNDRILGGDGDDQLDGGLGNDILSGEWGNDTFIWTIGEGVDSFHGGASLGDTINILGGAGTAVDTINVVWNGTVITGFGGTSAVTNVERIVADLGAGGDTITYAKSIVAVTVDLAGAASGFEIVSNIENATGGSRADTLVGNAAANVLIGNSGADRITGGAGNDMMTAGSGSDTFFFGLGFGVDTITDFDSDPGTGRGAGFDILNVRDLGITADNFAGKVMIAVVGTETQVTIDGDIIRLTGVTGLGANAITIADFSFV